MLAFLDPKAWLALLLVGMLSLSAGYFRGRHDANLENETQQQKAELKATNEVRKVEQQTAVNLNKVDSSYGTQTKKVISSGNAARAEFSGLRVKSKCEPAPAVAASASADNGTGTADANGNRPGEVDFSGIESEVIRLGEDYDRAIVKIDKLQETVVIYQAACSVNGIANSGK